MIAEDGLCIVVCTKPDYPVRVIFPSALGGGARSGQGLLGALAGVASEALGAEVFTTGAGSGGTVRKVQLAPRIAQQLERVCADFEDVGSHDKVARVQSEVDDVRNVMQGNIESMLANQELLTSLQGKTDSIAGQSKGFYRTARSTRYDQQCREMRYKLLMGGAVLLVVLFLFRGWIFGGDDDPPAAPASPSPPSPA